MSVQTGSMRFSQSAGLYAPGKSTAPLLRRAPSRAAERACQLRVPQQQTRCAGLRFGTEPIKRCSHSAVSAVQQRDSVTVSGEQHSSHSASGFGISLEHLQKLAGSRGTYIYENSELNSLFQLAESLRVSLEFGLVNDASDLEARRAAFGGNRLPDKAEVSWPAPSALEACLNS